MNPVLSEEYLNAHNAEIVAGPIDLSSCMDLSELSGTAILTSPKLFRVKGRNFLLHIKTMIDPAKDGQAKTRGKYINNSNNGCSYLFVWKCIIVRAIKPFPLFPCILRVI